MNQGKLEVVKQEMARVNVDILGIGELKWTGMGEFNTVLMPFPEIRRPFLSTKRAVPSLKGRPTGGYYTGHPL